MKDDNKDSKELKEQESVEERYSPDDRLTTQDIAEIDELVKKKGEPDTSDVKTESAPEKTTADLKADDVKPIAEEIRAARENGQLPETEDGLKGKISNWILGADENEAQNPKSDKTEKKNNEEKVEKNETKPKATGNTNQAPRTSQIWLQKRQEEAKKRQNNKPVENKAKGNSSKGSNLKKNPKQARPAPEKPKAKPITKKKPSKKQPSIIGSKKKPTRGLPKRHPKKPWARTLTICLVIILILGAIAASGVYLLYTANFTDISNTEYRPKEKTLIYTSDNVQIASLFSENRSYVSIEQIPDDLKNALIATEDSRFYTHNGVDYRGVIRALLSNIIVGNSTGQGASTITQQLARLLYLPDIANESTFMDSLNRKFKEISISYQLEDKYTKAQILEMYFNEYYFGSAAYGIEAASETYFGKNVNQLNLAECAMLAGLPQAPSVYAPNTNFEAAKNRQKQVLNRMVDAEYINQQQADEAYNTPINIIPWSEQSLNNQITPGYQNYVGKVISEYAKSVAPTIMRERGLTEDEAMSYARQNVASGGYKFYTTINSQMQATADGIMESFIANFGYDQESGYTGALVSVDRNGAVRSYYGGNEDFSSIDMANSARQPGSNIKPIYYAMALERGTFQPGSVLNDAPITIAGYSPHNSDGRYSGAISFSQSLIQSKNVTSVQIFNTLGTQAAVDWIKQFGFDTITDDDYNLAVALGGFTYGVKPYQMAAAFNTFNDGGVYNQAYFIERVTTTEGETVLDKNKLGLVSRQIMSPTTAQSMWDIMQGVVTGGTGTNAQNALPTAGKTGTTDNQENLWFTGMTGNLTTSIWLGNLDYYVIGGGSYMPASIYGGYLNTLHGQGLVN